MRFAYAATLAVAIPIIAVGPGFAQDALRAPGVLAAASDVTISAPISARITTMPYEAGQSFEPGARLVAFDCGRFDAELNEARASAGAAAARHAINRELDAYGAAGAGEVRVTGAEFEAATARVDALAEQVENCIVEAPFAGRVAENFVEAFETTTVGEDLMRIVAEGPPDIEIIAPSIWLRWLAPGRTFAFEVRETGETLRAKVVRTGATVDPVSQTVDLTGRFIDAPPHVLPGMSGAAVFDPE